jgi:hypothetical protein
MSLHDIFIRQHGLMNKFHRIQMANGLQEIPLSFLPIRDLNDRASQVMIRRYCWQIVEEMCEVMDELLRTTTRLEHLSEECADVMHFFSELAIIVGYTPEKLLGWDWDDVEITTTDVLAEAFTESMMIRLERGTKLSPLNAWRDAIHSVGMLSNLLKNRPWRTDHRPTNPDEFRERMEIAFRDYLFAVIHSGVTPEALEAAYFGKATINDARAAAQT